MSAIEACPAFKNAGEKVGLEIWRIEKMEPVRWPEKDYGQFYNGDAYIILNTKKAVSSNKFEYNLHFWLGQDCSQDEMGSAAIRTVELDNLVLGGSAVQYRETQNHESKLFLSYSKSGIRYLEGGTDSGFKTVDPDAFEKRLFQVKGKKNIRVGQVECKCSSLNQGDTFVLDCGRNLYVWIGPKSEKKEKLGGVETAQRIRDDERGGKAHIHVVEEDWETNDEFFKALGSKDKTIRAASDADDDDIVRKLDQEILLYRVTDADGKKPESVVEVGQRPLVKTMLDSNNCYVLDSGIAGVYVWTGKFCHTEFKNKVWTAVNGFLVNRGYPHWVSVTRVIDCGETSLFKQYFVGWGDESKPPPGPPSNGNTADQDYSGASGIDMDEMRKGPGKAEDWMPDDGSGKLEVWRIERFELAPVPEKAHGIMFGGDCYVILYTYLDKGKEKYIIYYWQGQKATTEDKAASAGQVVQLDSKLGGQALQIRVVEFKEPLHMLKIFKEKLIVFAGGHVKGYQSIHDHADYDARRLYMFQLHSDAKGNVKAIEVNGRAASLNSNDLFIVDNAKTTFAWIGKYCTDKEKEMAKYMATFMSPQRAAPIIIEEGKETEQFWSAIGGEEPYYTGRKQESSVLNIPPRLFQCSMTSGRFTVEEIVDFCQDDLDTTDVMLLDTHDEIFVWLGEDCREFEKKEAAKTAYNYLLSDPTGRTPDNTLIIVLQQGFEPPQFTGCFVAWDTNRWANGKTFKELIEEVGKENAGIGLLEDEVKKYHTFHPLEVLQRQIPPEGVDVMKKEMYLTDEDFVDVFGMTKEEYLKFAEWKRINLRKDHNLF